MTRVEADVLIVGGGPAALAAALTLRRHRVARVVVVEREAEAGGIPRHAVHTGFGLRDFRRVMSGPAYAAHYAALAREAGVDVRTSTTVLDWADATTLATTSPAGRVDIHAEAVLLATGCRERPRAARLIAGTRPSGVFTTGAVQQLVYLHRQRIGRRAVVVGAEHVSFSAVATLAHGGAHTVAMVTEHPCDQTYAPLRWVTTGWRRVPILTSTIVTRVLGRTRVEGVELRDRATGVCRTLACDTIVFTGDWIPDHELARRGGLVMDAASQGPVVDGRLRTSRRGVFAAGNLVHAAETADVAALSGRHAARAMREYLGGVAWPTRAPIGVRCEAPLWWASPSAVHPDDASLPHEGFVLRVREHCGPGRLVLRRGAEVLWDAPHRSLVPNRSIRARVGRVAVAPDDDAPLVFAVVA